MNKKNNKKNGFTLIELLAVIIILGILMIIAIPSVTSYINNSRKSAYVDTAKEIISGARAFVNEGKVPMYDTDVTYYINYKCISTENGSKSPYGDFVDGETFVVVTYTGKGFNYYWVSRDETGQGVNTITSLENLDEDAIVSDIKAGDIKTNVPVGSRTKTQEVGANCQLVGTPTQADTANAVPEGGNSGGNGGSTTPTNTAASTILRAAQTAGQLNQIPGTSIYIFKGGTTNPPANYVKFNGETWRIIGIYGDQMKIIRTENGVPTAPTGFTSIAFNSTTPNPGYAASSLKTSLNTTYYDTLTSAAKNMIDESAQWNVGPAAYTAIASEAYTQATTSGTKVGDTTHTTPWTGKVGLMASYEFLYATGGGDSCLTTAGSSYNSSCGPAANDWLKPGTFLWTLSPRGDNANFSLGVDSYGRVGYGFVAVDFAAVPAVFLKSSVTITSGDGTDPEHAYVLQ